VTGCTGEDLCVSGPGLGLLVLRSSDLGVARAFYEALGLTFVAEKHGAGPNHLAATLAGGVVLELYPATTTDGLVVRGGVGDVRLGLVVDDVWATVRTVREAGGEIVTEPTTEDGRHRAVLADPDGRRVELTSPA
jgi:lactoylglutathione lyase